MTPDHLDTTGSSTLVLLPVQAPAEANGTSALITRLVTDHGATWVDEQSIGTWSAQGGDCVVLFAGDPVQFPQGQDVAVVLPELQRCLPARFRIGVVERDNEAALALRYGSQRWPTLLFLRDGKYVTTLSGMHDWDDFLREMQQALDKPVSRAPIAVMGAGGNDASCH